MAGRLIRTLDAALVSPGEPTPFPNVRHAPDLSQGVAFNLANNIWGTNYVMWQPYVQQGATMRFRFEIAAGPVQPAPARETDQSGSSSASSLNAGVAVA